MPDIKPNQEPIFLSTIAQRMHYINLNNTRSTALNEVTGTQNCSLSFKMTGGYVDTEI